MWLPSIWISALLILCGVVFEQALTAQEGANNRTPAIRDEPAAKLDGKVIVERREVERLVASTVDPQRLTVAQQQRLWEEARQRLVGRHLWLARWQRLGLPPTEADIDSEWETLRERLEKEGVSWDQHLETVGVSEAAFRASIAWKLGWRAELQRTLTDENLRRYFETHRREFDGTKLEVSQILRQIEIDAPLPDSETIKNELEQLHQQIEQGEITFEEAARQHSEGASSAQGGRLGTVERYGAMPEAFNKAAFGLKVGEISPPIRTASGWHLIRCDREIPGTKSFDECYDEVHQAAAQAWFDLGVQEEMELHQVELLEER